MNLPLWFSNLLFWSAQVALLTLIAGFLPRLLQIRQPRVLLLYWRALLALCLLLPAIQPWHPLPTVPAIVFAPDNADVRIFPASSPVVSHWHLPSLSFVAQIVGFLIVAGIATRFAFLAMGILRLRQLRQSSSPVSQIPEAAAVLEAMCARVNTTAEFRLSPDVDSPVTFGFADPIVLLPERFPTMDARFQATIACHELLHVRRHDWAHHLTEEILRSAFWFHPAIAWLIARVRLAREQVVDLEVIRLTQERKPYLEALLEFAAGRSRTASVPAPPFLVERQLPERVALMLKEVRMSRTRLIASLTATACCIVLVTILAALNFPLKAAPRPGQNPPQGGVTHGVSSGVTGGVAQGISGGVAGGVSGGVAAVPAGHSASTGVSHGTGDGVARGANSSTSRDIPTVYSNTIWTDTVKRGPMFRQVRGLGTLVRAEDSANWVARISLPVEQTVDVKPSQNATIDTRKGLVKGHVTGINATASDGTRTIYVSLEGPLPEGAGADLPIDATIDIEKLDNILHVGRPVHATANSTISIFKLTKDGTEAERVNVKLGRSSVNSIEVLDGLKEGDKIILSDMSTFDTANHLHVK